MLLTLEPSGLMSSPCNWNPWFRGRTATILQSRTPESVFATSMKCQTKRQCVLHKSTGTNKLCYPSRTDDKKGGTTQVAKVLGRHKHVASPQKNQACLAEIQAVHNKNNTEAGLQHNGEGHSFISPTSVFLGMKCPASSPS